MLHEEIERAKKRAHLEHLRKQADSILLDAL